VEWKREREPSVTRALPDAPRLSMVDGWQGMVERRRNKLEGCSGVDAKHMLEVYCRKRHPLFESAHYASALCRGVG
jgi:hypothetical protein